MVTQQNVVNFRSTKSPQTEQLAALHWIADQVRGLVVRRPRPETMEVVRADDGGPSLGIPLNQTETLIVTPSIETPGTFAVLLAASDGVTTLSRSRRRDEVISLLRDAI